MKVRTASYGGNQERRTEPLHPSITLISEEIKSDFGFTSSDFGGKSPNQLIKSVKTSNPPPKSPQAAEISTANSKSVVISTEISRSVEFFRCLSSRFVPQSPPVQDGGAFPIPLLKNRAKSTAFFEALFIR